MSVIMAAVIVGVSTFPPVLTHTRSETVVRLANFGSLQNNVFTSGS